MIIEELCVLFEELMQKKTARQIARDFGRNRKWVSQVRDGCNFVFNPEFVAGLKANGYRLVLVKDGDDKC